MTRREAEKIISDRYAYLFADEPEISIRPEFVNEDDNAFHFVVYLYVGNKQDDFDPVIVDKASGDILPDFQFE